MAQSSVCHRALALAVPSARGTRTPCLLLSFSSPNSQVPRSIARPLPSPRLDQRPWQQPFITPGLIPRPPTGVNMLVTICLLSMSTLSQLPAQGLAHSRCSVSRSCMAVYVNVSQVQAVGSHALPSWVWPSWEGSQALGIAQCPSHPCTPLMATPLHLDSPLCSRSHPAPAPSLWEQDLETGRSKVKYRPSTPAGPWASPLPSSSYRDRAISSPQAVVENGARQHGLGAFSKEPGTQ